MDITEIVERLLAGFAQGHAQLEATVVALKSTSDDVSLPHRDSFFTHLLLRLYREALAKQQYQRIIPILHAWAAFGPADSLPSYLYGTRTFDQDHVEHWTREVLPVFRFVLGNYANRFSDEAVDAVLHDCATLGQAEPLLRQAPLADHILKNVQALAETAQYIRHQRFMRTIAHPQQQPQSKEFDDRLPLYRRRLFDEDLERECRTASPELPITLVMLDIDHFKHVNDTHGHPIGDAVLLECAKLVAQAVQGKGHAYRYGGEEFALVLRNATTEEGVALAERIRLGIESTTVTEKHLKVTLSCGLATAPFHATTHELLLSAADQALYQAKHLGRNLVRIAGEPATTPEPRRPTSRRQPTATAYDEQEMESLRDVYFRTHAADCFYDGARLQITEHTNMGLRTPGLIIVCPNCGRQGRTDGIRI
jgi:diguanylate cyclase (GGDEF)-like protein